MRRPPRSNRILSKPTKDALNWADKELRRMSLDEKIGQLIAVGVNATFLNQDSDAFKELRQQVERQSRWRHHFVSRAGL